MQASGRFDAMEVFISYRVETSAAIAALLGRALEVERVNAFIDFAELRTGSDWEQDLRAALAAPRLCVGVLVMDATWFARFRNPLAEDPVWMEVRALLLRAGLGDINEPDADDADPAARPDRSFEVFPIYVGDGQTTARFPPCGDDVDPLVRRLWDRLRKVQTALVVPRGDHGMPVIAPDIARIVRGLSSERRIFHDLKPAEVPPQPLFRLDVDRELRRGLRRDADTEIAALNEDLAVLTKLGQDLLLPTRDFDRAAAVLERAARHADLSRRTDASDVEQRAWIGHAANLLTIALLNGQRPRRLTLSQADRLTADILAPAMCVQFQRKAMKSWQDLDDGKNQWLHESATSVAVFSFDLLSLILADYYLERNNQFPVHRPGFRELQHLLFGSGIKLAERIDAMRPTTWAEAELEFLYADHLDGLGWTPKERKERQLEARAKLNPPNPG